jgi:hypothetical protein
VVPRLRALVVVPTRDLGTQVPLPLPPRRVAPLRRWPRMTRGRQVHAVLAALAARTDLRVALAAGQVPRDAGQGGGVGEGGREEARAALFYRAEAHMLGAGGGGAASAGKVLGMLEMGCR